MIIKERIDPSGTIITFKKEQLNNDGDVYQNRKNRKAKFEDYCYL